MVWLGNIALGLVWGWYMALVSRPPLKRPLLHTLLLALFTLFPVILIIFFHGLPALIRFILAALMALAVHLAWQKKINETIVK